MADTPPETPGQEPVEAPVETPPSPQLPPVETPAPEETPPEPEMSAEDKILHKIQSWQGRRDAELRQEMERREQALLGQIATLIPQSQVPAEEAPDPTVDANAWFEHKLKEKMTAQQQYQSTLVTTGMNLIDNDDLVKADPKLKDEILEEVQSGRVAVNNMLDAKTAASVAVAQAKANVLTRRLLKKTNPLAPNTPTTVPVGGVTPPAAPSAPKVKVPEMSDLTKSMAAKWGYTEEQMAEILKE